MMDRFYAFPGRVPAWPLVTQRTARRREHNAFILGTDAQRAGITTR